MNRSQPLLSYVTNWSKTNRWKLPQRKVLVLSANKGTSLNRETGAPKRDMATGGTRTAPHSHRFQIDEYRFFHGLKAMEFESGCLKTKSSSSSSVFVVENPINAPFLNKIGYQNYSGNPETLLSFINVAQVHSRCRSIIGRPEIIADSNYAQTPGKFIEWKKSLFSREKGNLNVFQSNGTKDGQIKSI